MGNMRIYGTTEYLEVKRLALIDEHRSPNMVKAIQVELAYRQRDLQWAKVREEAHAKWLATGCAS